MGEPVPAGDGFGGGGGVLGAGGGHILGDVHQHRALAAGLGNAESGPHGVGQLLHMPHNKVVLGDGHGDAGDENFLEAVLADIAGAHVAGEGHQGHAVHIGGGDAGDQVGGAGAAGGQHHAGAAGGPGVAVRRVAGALLVGGEHMADLVLALVQFVVEVQHRAARVAEQGIHALLHQYPGEDLRAGKRHVCFLLIQSFPFSRFPGSEARGRGPVRRQGARAGFSPPGAKEKRPCPF